MLWKRSQLFIHEDSAFVVFYLLPAPLDEEGTIIRQRRQGFRFTHRDSNSLTFHPPSTTIQFHRVEGCKGGSDEESRCKDLKQEGHHHPLVHNVKSLSSLCTR